MNFESINNSSTELEVGVEKEIKNLNEVFQIETTTQEGGQEKNIVKIAGIPLESYSSKEEIQEILSEIWPIRDTVKMLETMAVNYQLKRGLIIEGGTGIGKTFVVNKFAELVFGKGNKPIDFYCNGETSTFELLAKYVPNTEGGNNPEWEDFLQTREGQDLVRDLEKETSKKSLDIDKFEKIMTEMAKKAGVDSNVSNWSFQLGALPRAMTMPEDVTKPPSEENPARGGILHIQEVGIAQAEIINALLQLGGKEGRLADKINIWENGGREIEAGPDFWIVYSTNPPESYNSRQTIDQALLRRNSYLSLGEGDLTIQDEQLEEYFKDISQGNDTFEEFKKRKPELYNYALEKLKDLDIINLEKTEKSKIPSDIKDLIIELRSHFVSTTKKALRAEAINADRLQKIEFTADHKMIADAFIERFLDLTKIEEIIDKSFELFYFDCFNGKDKEEVCSLYQEIKEKLETSEKLSKATEQEQNTIDLIKEGEDLIRDIEEKLQLKKELY